MLSARFFRFFQHLNWTTIKEVIDSAGKQRLPGLSAEMAYNAMLGLFPAILAVLTAIGLFESLQGTLQRLASQLSQVAPEEVQILIQNFVRGISQTRNRSLFSLSFIAAIWASSGALSAAMTAFDHIQQVPPEQTRPFWKAKLVSVALTVGTILLLLMASFLMFISDLIVKHVASQSGFLGSGLLSTWRLLSWPLALGIVSAAFAFIYRYGPSQWKIGTPIMPGAVLAAVFWAILSSLFRYYVSHFGDFNRAYGAIGAVIVLLLWLYLSSLVLLIGNQLNVTVGAAMRQQHRQNVIQAIKLSRSLQPSDNPTTDSQK
ncbi:YihY/virulence factor BrkB family protein [Trichocoleus desertorum AS-A10]|uniref:YihY/virulence factor BrkB family protein n=1 Tax=Trichocoleus desertorum TaxID=1481672 RepID=UPI003296868A